MFHPNVYKRVTKKSGVLLLTLLGMAMSQLCLAQTPIKGTVLDDFGYPLPGAKVHIKGDTSIAITGRDGAFQLSATAGTTLVFERQGYNVSDVRVVTGRELSVRMPVNYLRQTPSPGNRAKEKGDTIFLSYNTTRQLN